MPQTSTAGFNVKHQTLARVLFFSGARRRPRLFARSNSRGGASDGFSVQSPRLNLLDHHAVSALCRIPFRRRCLGALPARREVEPVTVSQSAAAGHPENSGDDNNFPKKLVCDAVTHTMHHTDLSREQSSSVSTATVRSTCPCSTPRPSPLFSSSATSRPLIRFLHYAHSPGTRI